MIAVKAIINNSTCMIVSRERLTRGTVGKTMEAEFSAEWEGLAITATFEAGDEKRDKIYTGEPIVIPHEVLSTAGVSVLLGFQGAMPDGTIVKRTEKEWLNNVSETLDPAGVPSSEPTPDWTAQVQNIATEAKNVADSVRSDADEGKFNGLTGPKGDKGDKGETGPKGDKGDTGPAGATGPKGDKGDTGPAGSAGPAGKKGDTGPKGEKGDTGEPGGWYTPAVTQPDANTMRFSFTPSKEGMPEVPPKDIAIPGGGGSGEAGGYYAPAVDAAGNLTWTASKTDMPAVDGANIKGPKGDTGAPGAQGPAGATGAQGPQGPKGDTGATGATGPAGANGKSAYAYAVEGGYTGTEAEFAAKLAAEKFANPNALTFTGAVTGSYDGSEALTVNIPSGGGSGVVTGTYDFSVLARGTFPANTITEVTLGNGLIDTGITLGMLRQYKIFNMAYRCDSANQYYCFAVGKANQTPARFVRFIYSTKNATNSTVFWIDNAKTSVIMLSGIGNADVTQPLAAENMGGFLPNGLTSIAAAMGSINAYGNLADYPDESKIYVGVMHMNGQTTNTKDLTWSICGVVR